MLVTVVIPDSLIEQSSTSNSTITGSAEVLTRDADVKAGSLVTSEHTGKVASETGYGSEEAKGNQGAGRTRTLEGFTVWRSSSTSRRTCIRDRKQWSGSRDSGQGPDKMCQTILGHKKGG